MLNLVRDEAAPPVSPPPPPPPAALATQVQDQPGPGYWAPPPRNVGLQPYLELHISVVVRGGRGHYTTSVSCEKGNINSAIS